MYRVAYGKAMEEPEALASWKATPDEGTDHGDRPRPPILATNSKATQSHTLLFAHEATRVFGRTIRGNVAGTPLQPYYGQAPLGPSEEDVTLRP